MAKAALDSSNAHLVRMGRMLRQGSVVDATIVSVSVVFQ
jgi:hypothetical protein